MSARSSLITGVAFRSFPFFVIAILSLLITLVLINDSSPESQAVISAVPLNVMLLYLLYRHRSIVDGNFVFLLFFALHYSIMVPLYTTARIWASFWQSEIAFDWALTTKCNIISTIALAGYALGIFSAEAHYRVKKQQGPPTSGAAKAMDSSKQIRKLIGIFIAVGLLSWIAILVQNSDISDLLLGRPLNRMTFPDYGGAYLFMLLFCIGHAYLLFTVLVRKSRYFLILSILAILPTLYLLLIKGARHEFVVVPFAAYILFRKHGSKVLKNPLFYKASRTLFALIILALSAGFLVFYTRYRSGLESYTFEEIPYFLHSLADAAGYMIVVKTVPETFDYWYGMTYLYPILNHIPAAIFPSKYEYMYGVNRFTELFYGYNATLDTSTVSHTYSLLGEVYFNFGVLGTPFALFVLGYVITRMYLHYRSNNSSLFYCYCYALFVPIFILYTVKAGIVSGLIYYLQNVLMIFAFPLLFFYRKYGISKKLG